MDWINKFRLAEIHREVYVAIIQSWVPHGQREEFARRCGIPREYLSYLCFLGSDKETYKRYPSSDLAKKMAKALPAPEEVRRSLLENMQLAPKNATKASYFPQKGMDHKVLTERLSEIERVHREATFGKNLAEVQRSYRVVRDASSELLQGTNPEEYAESFVQACLYYHDAQCILNRPDEALRYAKIAQCVLEGIDEIETGFSREARDNLEINAIRGEAVALHNLQINRNVPDILLNRACKTPAFRNARSFWEPLVMRDLINAMVEIPRFSVREVNRTARQIESVCENKGDEFTLLLVRESWLRSLIQQKNKKMAQRVFREEMDRLPRLPFVGALHRALLLKSGAQLSWELHDQASWKTYISEALSLMRKAGLKHQISQVRQTYRAALDPIFIELGMVPKLPNASSSQFI